jgi:uncharacterized protein YeaO (DUF488 family)
MEDKMTIQLKRVYEASDEADGKRILIDRLWPQGESKVKADLYLWMKEIAPSVQLRKWFEHDPGKWTKFKADYFEELNNNQSDVDKLLTIIKSGTVTFVYASKEEKMNNAVALKEYIESIMQT